MPITRKLTIELLEEAANCIAEEYGEDPDNRDPIEDDDDSLVGRLRLHARNLASSMIL